MYSFQLTVSYLFSIKTQKNTSFDDVRDPNNANSEYFLLWVAWQDKLCCSSLLFLPQSRIWFGVFFFYITGRWSKVERRNLIPCTKRREKTYRKEKKRKKLCNKHFITLLTYLIMRSQLLLSSQCDINQCSHSIQRFTFPQKSTKLYSVQRR